MPEITISHGIPKHAYFCIVQPRNDELRRQLQNIKLLADWKPKVICLADPITNENHNCEVVDIWHFPINEMPQMFSLLTYGKTADELKPLLLKRYPQLTKPNSEVEYWLLKKI